MQLREWSAALRLQDPILAAVKALARKRSFGCFAAAGDIPARRC